MTPIAIQLDAIGIAVLKLKKDNPEAPPVVVAPAAWMHGVAATLGQSDDMVPQSIHGCPVIQKDDIDEPVIITHDGKAYKVSSLIVETGQ